MNSRFDFSSIFGIEPIQHILVVGSTGTGKTNDCKNLAYEAVKRGFSVIVIDPKGEYLDLADVSSEICETTVFDFENEDKRFFWNPLQPPTGVNPDLWAKTFSDVFTRSYGLSEPSRRILYDSLVELYVRHGVYKGYNCNYPTIRELEDEISRFKPRSRNEENSKIALENRIHIVASGELGDSLSVPIGYTIEDFENRLVVIDLSSIPSVRDQRFIIEALVASIWEYKKKASNQSKFLLVLEEAHRYVPEERPSIYRGDRTLVELAIAEGRTFGIYFVIADQMPSLLSKYALSNCGIKIVHRLESAEQIEVVTKSIGILEVDFNLMEELRSMKTGEALVVLPGIKDLMRRMSVKSMPIFSLNPSRDLRRSFKKSSRREFLGYAFPLV